MQKLDQYIAQINSDATLKHKIEAINLLLTNQMINEDEQASSISNSNLDQKLAKKGPTNQINYDEVDLLIIDIKKYIANYVNSWNNRIAEFFNKKSKHEDVINICAV